MKNFKILILLIFLAKLNFAQVIINSPECVTYSETLKTYFVSDFLDGKIYKIYENGFYEEFINTGTLAYSSTIYNETFYVSTGRVVKGYNIETGEQVFNLSITDSHQLDGMCTDNAGNLYVCDFHFQGDDDKIIKINILEETHETFCEEPVISPQDLLFDEATNSIIVADNENLDIFSINITSGEITTLAANTVGGYDGIARDNQGNY